MWTPQDGVDIVGLGMLIFAFVWIGSMIYGLRKPRIKEKGEKL